MSRASVDSIKSPYFLSFDPTFFAGNPNSEVESIHETPTSLIIFVVSITNDNSWLKSNPHWPQATFRTAEVRRATRVTRVTRPRSGGQLKSDEAGVFASGHHRSGGHVYMYIYVYVYVCIDVYIYIYIDR